MSKQTVKEAMQQALGMLEKGGINGEQEEFVAQSIRKASEEYKQAETQEPVRRLSDVEIVSINTRSVSIFTKAYAIMDACNIPKKCK